MPHVSRKVVREQWELQLDGDEAYAVYYALQKASMVPGFTTAGARVLKCMNDLIINNAQEGNR